MNEWLDYHLLIFQLLSENQEVLAERHTYNRNISDLESNQALLMANNHHITINATTDTTGKESRAETPPHPIPGLP